MKTLSTLLAAALLLGGAPAAQHDGDGHAHGHDHAAQAVDAAGASDDAVIADQLPSYPLDTCVVSGEGLHEMGEPLNVVHEGRLVRLCCKGCKRELAKDPEGVIAKIDAAVVEAQLPSYPLETCAVSGEKLGSMGEPLNVVHGTRLVRLCCKGCKKALAKDPGKALAKIDAALIEAQRESYPLETCVVSGGKLGSMGDPIDHLYGTRLVRFCCAGCIKKFEAEPAKFLSKLGDGKDGRG